MCRRAAKRGKQADIVGKPEQPASGKPITSAGKHVQASREAKRGKQADVVCKPEYFYVLRRFFFPSGLPRLRGSPARPRACLPLGSPADQVGSLPPLPLRHFPKPLRPRAATQFGARFLIQAAGPASWAWNMSLIRTRS